MTAAPHLVPLPGPAADFAARLRAGLPTLRTARLILRAPVLEDAPHWISILSPDAQGHLGGPHTEDEAFTEFAATCGLWLLRGHGLFTVTDQSDAVLGFVLIGFEPGDREPELGWLFLPQARGQGYAAEAAACLRDHGFVALGRDRLISYIDPGNAASIRLAQRLGAALEGEVDGAQVWVHRKGAVAQRMPVSQTSAIRKPYVNHTSKRGD
jgi:RimJ/RimL family protein N-acetyltransferase